jgi:hypothetical protein
MTAKQALVELVNSLPDDVGWDDAEFQLASRRKFQENAGERTSLLPPSKVTWGSLIQILRKTGFADAEFGTDLQAIQCAQPKMSTDTWDS